MSGRRDAPLDPPAVLAIPRSGGGVLSSCSLPFVLVLLILFAILPYANILLNDFVYVYDDRAQIFDNPFAHSFRYLGQTFTSNVWSYVGIQAITNYYRPMTTFWFLLCYKTFGLQAYGFHLASLFLHAAVVCILCLVTERLFRDRLLAFVAAGLFALHPIHSESVAWVSGVTDLEVTFFYLLTFWFFLSVAAPDGQRRPWVQLAMSVSFLLTIFSKEQALTLPFLATLYEHFYREDHAQTTWRQKLFRYVILWLLELAYILFRIRLLGVFAGITGMHQITHYEAFLSALALIGQYLWKLLWPAHLLAFYVFRKSVTLLDIRVLAGLGVLILSGIVFSLLWKRARLVSFGLLWFLIALVPVLNSRWLGSYVFAERYLYLASVGFCWVVAWGWTALWRSGSDHRVPWRGMMVFASCAIAVLCAFRIFTRNRDWRDDVTLLTRTLPDTPDEYQILDGLGLAYWVRGDAESAEREWLKTLRLAPDNVRTLNSLGMAYAKKGRYAEAAKLFQRALELQPKDSNAHLNLGAAYAEIGRLAEAEQQFRAAALLSPLNFQAHNVLGKLYFDAGRLREAEEQFRQSVESERNVAAYDHLGYIYQRWGDYARAEHSFRAALALKASDSHAHFNLGLIYAATGRNADAAREYRAALETDPNNPEVLSALQKMEHQGHGADRSDP